MFPDMDVIDPHRTWVAFRDNSDKGGNKKPRKIKGISKVRFRPSDCGLWKWHEILERISC